MTQKYIVRQYRPNYVSGFENEVHHGIAYDEITALPFCGDFKHDGFKEFTIQKFGYEGELVISAHYANGEHWVVGFAIKDDCPFKNNWRYVGTER